MTNFCDPCKDGGRANTTGDYELARKFHAECPGSSQCFCQHATGPGHLVVVPAGAPEPGEDAPAPPRANHEPAHHFSTLGEERERIYNLGRQHMRAETEHMLGFQVSWTEW